MGFTEANSLQSSQFE